MNVLTIQKSSGKKELEGTLRINKKNSKRKKEEPKED